MVEFCPECFIKILCPELSYKDLVIIKEPDLCEGCGKNVEKTVLRIKDTAKYKMKK